MSDSEGSLPRLLGGRYRLDAKLGHGGMGVVYRATDLTMQRAVAVKLIRGDDGVEIDEDVAGRFVREAKNTARVQHEHIIEVYDFGHGATGDLFFVMELLEGESLSTKLRREVRLAPDVMVHIGAQICAALEVAHRAGVIHRDLKPANVMLTTRAGDRDFVKVLDFGVSKSYSPDQETQLTHTGMLVGTIDYMAPEQIMGRPVDGRTDIYSLGVVLYRMLAGKLPFRDAGLPALINAHLNVVPKPISHVVGDVPPELEAVVMKALAKDPTERWSSMDQLGRALVDSLRVGVVDLDYSADDPYEASDATKVAPRTLPVELDDETVKLSRSERLDASRSSAQDFADRTQVMPKDASTLRRSAFVRPSGRATSRACAMCMTVNPPQARQCAACGVSLAAGDQQAVRERVNPPSTARHPAAVVPPSHTASRPLGSSAPILETPALPRAAEAGTPALGGLETPAPSGFWQRFVARFRGR